MYSFCILQLSILNSQFSAPPRSMGSKTPVLHPAEGLIEPECSVAAVSDFGGSTLTDFDASLCELASEIAVGLAVGCGEGVEAGFDSPATSAADGEMLTGAPAVASPPVESKWTSSRRRIISKVWRSTTTIGPTTIPIGPSAVTPPSTLSKASSGWSWL